MKTIHTALAAAQANIGAASKGADNPFFKSKYADLATVMEVVKAPLLAAGITVTQEVGFQVDGEIISDTLTTTLRHVDGETISSIARIPPTKDIQKFGGAISYMKRYALQAILFVPTEDLDAEDTMSRKPKVVKKVQASNVPF